MELRCNIDCGGRKQETRTTFLNATPNGRDHHGDTYEQTSDRMQTLPPPTSAHRRRNATGEGGGHTKRHNFWNRTLMVLRVRQSFYFSMCEAIDRLHARINDIKSNLRRDRII
eukprot:scaffold762_cov363-Pavlova_lutheri.AAC.43